MKAIILAAGRGERLRPLTDRVPKPLIEVGGKALIAHHLNNLAQAGIREVVINLAWLGHQIETALGEGGDFGLTITYSREPAGALETAGGIIRALPLLGEKPFLMLSADVFCDYSPGRLHRHHLQGLGHLIMVENPPHHPDGDFAITPSGRLREGSPTLTFSGIALLHPKLFDDWPAGRCALRPVLDKALAQRALTGEIHAGIWSDVGTTERLSAIRRQIET